LRHRIRLQRLRLRLGRLLLRQRRVGLLRSLLRRLRQHRLLPRQRLLRRPVRRLGLSVVRRLLPGLVWLAGLPLPAALPSAAPPAPRRRRSSGWKPALRGEPAPLGAGNRAAARAAPPAGRPVRPDGAPGRGPAAVAAARSRPAAPVADPRAPPRSPRAARPARRAGGEPAARRPVEDVAGGRQRAPPGVACTRDHTAARWRAVARRAVPDHAFAGVRAAAPAGRRPGP